jgi:hypothetical protein
MTIQTQDQAAQRLVDALARHRGELSPEARAILLRVCGGHERRTVGLLSMAAAEVRRSGDVIESKPETRNPFKWWLRREGT